MMLGWLLLLLLMVMEGAGGAPCCCWSMQASGSAWAWGVCVCGVVVVAGLCVCVCSTHARVLVVLVLFAGAGRRDCCCLWCPANGQGRKESDDRGTRRGRPGERRRRETTEASTRVLCACVSVCVGGGIMVVVRETGVLREW